MCFICAKEPASTDDHVPAQGFFPDGHPQKGFPLPACLNCNGNISKVEQLVRNTFSILANSPEAEEAFRKTVRDVARTPMRTPLNSRLKALIDQFKAVELRTPGGVFAGHALSFEANEPAVQVVALKTVAGLHYKHSGTLMSYDAEVSVSFPPRDLFPELHSIPPTYSGKFGDVFEYQGLSSHDRLAEIWWLRFYKTILIPVLVEDRLKRAQASDFLN